MRSILAIVPIGAMILGLSGCGDTNSVESTQDTSLQIETASNSSKESVNTEALSEGLLPMAQSMNEEAFVKASLQKVVPTLIGKYVPSSLVEKVSALEILSIDSLLTKNEITTPLRSFYQEAQTSPTRANSFFSLLNEMYENLKTLILEALSNFFSTSSQVETASSSSLHVSSSSISSLFSSSSVTTTSSNSSSSSSDDLNETTLSSSSLSSSSSSVTLSVDAIENYGAEAFYKTYYGNLHVTPNTNGTSTIVTSDNSFTQEYLNKEFVAFRIHKNPRQANEKRDYFPNTIGSRYSKVVEVIDEKTLIVDFTYNGGSIDTPQVSENVSGYFFFDNKAAFIKAVTSNERNEVLTLREGVTYVTKGTWDVITPSDIIIKTEDNFSTKARIKLSAEDVMSKQDYTDIGEFENRWFNMNDDDFDIKLQNINFVGPHYTTPTVQLNGYSAGFFGGTSPDKQSARTLEVYGSDDWTEYYELRDSDTLKYLPAGYNFVGSNFIDGIIYGGKHDGVKTTDWIYLNCINTSMHIQGFASMKTLPAGGAGIYTRIIGESPENKSEIIEQDIKSNRINLVEIYGDDGAIETGVKFSLDEDTNNSLNVQIMGDGSWYQMAIQYWSGGVDTGIITPVYLKIGDIELQTGNDGDWQFKYGKNVLTGFQDGENALFFEKPTKQGDTLRVGQFKTFADIQVDEANSSKLLVWGKSMQVGDILNIDGSEYSVLKRNTEQKKYIKWSDLDPERFPTNSSIGGIHYNHVTLDRALAESFGEGSSVVVVKSATQTFLDGGVFQAKITQDRGYIGHLFYTDFNFPYHFENVKIHGYFRGETRHDKNNQEYPQLYMYPAKMDNGYEFQWINVEYDDEEYASYFGYNNTLQLKAKYSNQNPDDFRILLQGDNTFVNMVMRPTSDKILVKDGTLTLGFRREYSRAEIYSPIFENASLKIKHNATIVADSDTPLQIKSVELLQSTDSIDTFYLSNKNGGIHIGEFITHPSTNGLNKHGLLYITDNAQSSSDITIEKGEGFIYLNETQSTPNFNHSINISNWSAQEQAYGNVLGFNFAKKESDYINFCDAVNIVDTNEDTIIEYCKESK